jgi:Tol biopolymer transport system component
MNAGDDAVLLELADAVLDGQPFHWIAARAGSSDAIRTLIPHLRVVSRIAAIARPASGQSALLDTDLLPDGAAWGPLTNLTLIGRGSFGLVYRAYDGTLDRVVALKLLRRRRDVPVDGGVAEGRLMARVRHPNVVTVYGADRHDGRVGLWMEYVDGGSLEDELAARGPLPLVEVVAIGRDLCAALDAIHRAGLLHRDLKAHNVLRDRAGRIQVTDFGTGLDAARSESERALAGTPLYLAPELLAGGAPSHRSDIYSLGVLLFHLLTASYPVIGDSLDDVRLGHRTRRRRSLWQMRPDLDGAVIRVVERAIAANPDERYSSATAMAAALAANRTEPVTAKASRGGAVLVAALVTAMVGGIWSLRPQVAAPAPASIGRLPLPAGQVGVPAADGRAVPYIDTAGRAQIWDLVTRASRPLIRDDDGVRADVDVVISPDGNSLAVATRRDDDSWELRRLDTAGSAPRPLIARQTAYQPVPVDWSRDGQHVLCWLRQQNGSVDLVLVPAEGGTTRLLRTFSGIEPAGARLAPDGRFVAVVLTTMKPAARADLVLLDAEHGTVQPLAANVTPLSDPEWTRDGSAVFFLRDSATVAGSRDGWTVPVADGRATGSEVLAAADLGEVSRATPLDGARLGRVIWNVSTDVYTRTIDVTGRTPAGPTARIAATRIGNHVAPSWSPDGRALALFTTRPAAAASGVPLKMLTIRDAAGRLRDVPSMLGFLGGYSPEWMPGGRAVVVWGSDDGSDARLGYYQIALTDGSPQPLVLRGQAEPANAAVSPDGRTLYYRAPGRGLVAHSLTTASDRVVVAGATGPFQLSRDGTELAFTRPEPDGSQSLSVQPLDGPARELVRVQAPESLRVHGWSRLDDAVLHTRAEANRPHELWVVPVRGGPPRRLDATFIRSGSSEPNGFSLHVDGATLAYTERVVQPELWITAWPAARTSTSR